MSTVPLVELRGVTVIGDDGEELVSNSTFAIHEGERVALVGPNGAGKTTLAKVLTGLQRTYRGSVSFLPEREVRNISPRELSRLVSYVPQRIENVPHFTASEFLNLSAPHADLAICASFVEGLLDRALPDLSGGELQRVLLAGAIVQGAKLIVMDEPTASLDPKGRREVEELLRAAVAVVPFAYLLITHDITLAARCTDRMVILKDGHILWDGAAVGSDVLPQLEQAYECQFRRIRLEEGSGELIVPV